MELLFRTEDERRMKTVENTNKIIIYVKKLTLILCRLFSTLEILTMLVGWFNIS